MNSDFTDAKNIAIKYLTVRDRTENELVKKLKCYDFTDDVIENVILLMKKYNYINDYIFTEKFINEKISSNKYGLIKIRYDLELKGINSKIIDEVIEQLDIDELSMVIELLNKKLTDTKDIKLKRRIYNFLIRRGYSHDVIMNGFRSFESELFD